MRIVDDLPFGKQDGSRQLELSLYLQYDYHVQQAVDEKMTTRCRLQTSEKSSTESPVTQPPSSLQQRHSAIFSLLEKSGRRNEAGPPATTIKNALLPFRPLMNNSLTPTTSSPGKLSGLPLTSYQGKVHIHFTRLANGVCTYVFHRTNI